LRRPLQPIVNRLPRSIVNLIKYQVGRLLASKLDVLGVLWGTDNARGHHCYTPLYASHLRRARRSIRSVLEIEHWLRGRFESGRRVVAFKGDQSDPAALQEVVQSAALRSIWVIDDGSHIGSHVIASFGVLFPGLPSVWG
jgi:hypothetical protein